MQRSWLPLLLILSGCAHPPTGTTAVESTPAWTAQDPLGPGINATSPVLAAAWKDDCDANTTMCHGAVVLILANGDVLASRTLDSFGSTVVSDCLLVGPRIRTAMSAIDAQVPGACGLELTGSLSPADLAALFAASDQRPVDHRSAPRTCCDKPTERGLWLHGDAATRAPWTDADEHDATYAGVLALLETLERATYPVG